MARILVIDDRPDVAQAIARMLSEHETATETDPRRAVSRVVDGGGFDVVLIDSGPLLPCVETTVIARQVDGVVLAIGCGQKQALARDAIVKLGQLKANVLGTVFNGAEVEDFYQVSHHHRILCICRYASV